VRGTIWSTLRDDTRNRSLVSFPPRYNGVASAVATSFGAVERDGFLRRGWREMRAFLGSIFGRPAAPAAAPATNG
jgi:hypothetical protein